MKRLGIVGRRAVTLRVAMKVNKIDEKIHIENYNPEWPILYETEKETLERTFKDLIKGIEHFGSTAVPKLKTKPIIDILIGLNSLDLDEKTLLKFTELGYEYLGEAGVPGRLYFRKRREHSYNLALVIYESELWNNNIIIRDYLRTHPDEAKKYGAIKSEIISKGINTLLEYSDRKNAYILELLNKAKSWKKERY